MYNSVIHCLVPIALKEVMEVLGPQFEAETGYQLHITHSLNPEVPAAIASGVSWDIALTNPQYIDEIISAGHSAANSHQRLGRSPLAFAARGTEPVPIAETADELATLLESAQSIALTRSGTSGQMFCDLAKSLGVWNLVEHRLIFMEGGGPIRAVTAGEVELATVPLTNIITIPGITPVGVCPDELHVHIDVSFCLKPGCIQAAHELAAWLKTEKRQTDLESLGVFRR